MIGFTLHAVEIDKKITMKLGIQFVAKNKYCTSRYKDVFITILSRNIDEYDDEPGFYTSQSLLSLLNDIKAKKEIKFGFGDSFVVSRNKGSIIVDYICLSQYDSADILLQRNIIIFENNTATVISLAFCNKWGDEKYKKLVQIFSDVKAIEKRSITQGISNNEGYDNELIWKKGSREIIAKKIQNYEIDELVDWYSDTEQIVSICVNKVTI
jgi:hypothetical protein